MFIWPSGEVFHAYNFKQFNSTTALLETTPIKNYIKNGGRPGGILSISANGKTNGIIWGTIGKLNANQKLVNGTIYAFDALDIKSPIWQTSIGIFPKFNPPTVVNGRVFVPCFPSRPSVNNNCPITVSYTTNFSSEKFVDF
jgi:hypothetical protein